MPYLSALEVCSRQGAIQFTFTFLPYNTQHAYVEFVSLMNWRWRSCKTRWRNVAKTWTRHESVTNTHCLNSTATTPSTSRTWPKCSNELRSSSSEGWRSSRRFSTTCWLASTSLSTERKWLLTYSPLAHYLLWNSYQGTRKRKKEKTHKENTDHRKNTKTKTKKHKYRSIILS